MTPFSAAFAVVRVPNAEYFVGDLFLESFGSPFPVPREHAGLSIPTPPAHWHQFVALYKWPDQRIETVGFCNWIRHKTVYLEGGLCVRRGFYRRLPPAHLRECSNAGGVAQLMMEAASEVLNDCDAWFGYCGDKKAYRATMRVGYVPLQSPYLIAKWFRELPQARRQELEADVARIGPF